MLCISPIFPQEYSYRHYTVKDGLAQNQVITMFQDRMGYLWLGTKGGVSRFDGLKFQNYTVNDGLLSNYIIKIFEDTNGRIYFCSIIGISCLEQGKISTVLLNDTIQSNKNILIIPRFTETEFCVLNFNNIPFFIDQYDASLIKSLSDLTSIRISQIIKDDNYNKYWIRSAEGDIYCIKNDSLIKFNEKFIGNFVKNKSGKILGYDGKSIYQPDTLHNRLNLLYNLYEEETAILYDFDFDNNALIGLGQKKILKFDGSETLEFRKKFNYINKLLIDKDNTLWIATETGFYRKINQTFENFTTETGSNEYVWSLVEDENRNIWFASYGDGLRKWDGKAIKIITDYKQVYHSSQGNYFYTGAILASNHNIYYPVKEKGILQYDGSNYSLIDRFPKGSVLDVYEDSINNSLLAASTAGLIVIDEFKSPVLYEKEFIKSGKYIKTIAQDKYGRYWLGGEYILSIFDGQDFIEFPNKDYDYKHGAISIFMDSRKNLWLGTTSGLYFYNYMEFIKIAKNTLKSQVVSFVELDSSKLVMGISEGMAIFDLYGFYENGKENIEILDDSKGFLGFDCIRNGILKDSDNNIWFATSDRVVKFYTDRLRPDTIKPIVVIQQIAATGSHPDEVTAINLESTLDNNIELPYLQKNIRLDFHTIHFYAPEKIIYKYKLVGYENNWSIASTERYASYTNLSPGKYTFEVTAQNIDGIWSEQAARVSFEIIPAFWQTLTFKILLNLLIIITTLAIIYFIWRFRRKRKQRIEQTEKQISELQLKTIRSQMDPHFTFNALNSISSVIYKEDKEKAYRYFTKFSKLVRSSLEVSDKITRSLEEEIDFTKNYLDLEKIRFKDQFEFLIHTDNNVNMETKVPKMILHNYAENAVKHGLKHKEGNRILKIEIFLHDDVLNISIKDNGVGRKQARALNEFSTGKGLKIMNTIYDLYFKLYKVRIEQEIEDLSDDLGNATGTRVIVKIPILN